jgi:hypothetical protein
VSDKEDDVLAAVLALHEKAEEVLPDVPEYDVNWSWSRSRTMS